MSALSHSKMTDCHDWFAEVAEGLVRYLVAKSGYEVFGQSEWGADLAIHDRASRRWIRCEVRSSDSNVIAKQKPSKTLAKIAELEAAVTLIDPTKFRVVFFILNEKGCRIVPSPGAAPILHEYTTSEALKEWLHKLCFSAAAPTLPSHSLTPDLIALK